MTHSCSLANIYVALTAYYNSCSSQYVPMHVLMMYAIIPLPNHGPVSYHHNIRQQLQVAGL